MAEVNINETSTEMQNTEIKPEEKPEKTPEKTPEIVAYEKVIGELRENNENLRKKFLT